MVLLLAATPVFAQEAGSLLKDIERGREQQQLPRKKPAELLASPSEMKAPSGLSVSVREFHFAGNTLLSNEQLAPVVAEYLNRPIGFAELQKAAAAVAEAYRKAGWIVRVYLPHQDITEGIVTIQIVEAVFGSVKLEGQPATRFAFERIQKSFDAQQPKGAKLNANALDRALLLADDLPGVAVSGSLHEGANPRETDLILKVADEPLVVGEVNLDNIGSRATGSDRLAANLNLNSLAGYGDLLAGNVIHTQGSDYLRLAYILPAGVDGWRVGANASALNYRLIAPEFAALNGNGTSSTAGLEATYPIIRSRLKNLYLAMNYDNKQFDNQSSNATQSRYQINAVTAALNGNSFDNLGGGGANSGSLAFISGSVALDSRDPRLNAGLNPPNGGYYKLRYSLARQQVITDTVALYAALSGQEANGKNLDSSEKFYLGGANGVRAYPASEGGGSSGALTSLELRGRLPKGFVLTGFYDYGDVRNYDGGKSYALQGVGMTLAWQAEASLNGLNLKATLAQRIGSNPNPTANGYDQNGSLTKNRFWLAATQPF
ncbi:MAG: ShlB/FhaC/HecB family hemolysin secretion/activation protein [Undibacterium sp.]|uniref:ShlB/FhaC/HecB family hemolysin secretion/activation protein n=1 Tax=Undibacterium sp. TaxID=1914977 RepID=UPI0027192B0E|nr:ShlB/FhaC/HecB family hemolysin secretion/activation protein [Undibacterium sp.]MDO8651220.1 ShlB/FhaC/HecB family hemolysin secretion/activation protein [Undibacterium sp.]